MGVYSLNGPSPHRYLGGVYGLGNVCAPYERGLTREEERQYTPPVAPSRFAPVSVDDCEKASAAAKLLASALRFIKRIQYVNDGFQQSAEGDLSRAEDLIRSMASDNKSMIINLNEVRGLLKDRDFCLQNLDHPLCAQIKEQQERTAAKAEEQLQQWQEELDAMIAAGLTTEEEQCRSECVTYLSKKGKSAETAFTLCEGLYQTGTACDYKNISEGLDNTTKYIKYAAIAVVAGVGLYLTRPLFSIVAGLVNRRK